MHARHIVVALTMMACGATEQAMSSGGNARFVVPETADHGGTRLVVPAAAPRSTANVGVGARGVGVNGDRDNGLDTPYDHVVQKSIHNAYDQLEPLIDQLVYHRVRSLELDIHTARDGKDAPSGDWFVYHADHVFMRDTSCSQLTDCLGQIAGFHGAVPQHEVVTLFVDLKDDFNASSGHRPSDLDATFARALGKENIVSPSDVMAMCPGSTSVRDAVTGACRFPTLRSLRGKFLLVTTGGTACEKESLVSSYGGDRPRERLAFVGPNVDDECPVASYDNDAHPDVVFFNMPLSERSRAMDVKRRGLVARIYGGGLSGGLDTRADFLSAKAAGAIHLATDKVSDEADAWSRTSLARGFPFTCNPSGCAESESESAALEERSAIVGLRAKSGDQEGTSDDALFAWEKDTGDATWTSLVSVPSSHVDDLAKACLVARASQDPGAPNVAVCRTFDVNGPRVQVRSTAGGATTTTALSAFKGLTDDTPAFLRLTIHALSSHLRDASGSSSGVSSDGATEVTSSTSRDGNVWVTIGKTTIPAPLPFRGVSVSSHGGPSVKALFANLTRERNGITAAMNASALQKMAVGSSVRGDLFDGITP